MPERPVINTLAGQASPLLFADVRDGGAIAKYSLFQPTMWEKSTPFVIDHHKIHANNPFAFETDVNFEYTKSATLLGDVCLEIRAPPHTVTNNLNPLNPPGTAYYVDHLGYAFIHEMNLHYGQNKVFDHQKYDYYFRYREKHTREIRDAINDCVVGDKTSAERAALLLNGSPQGQPILVPLDYQWSQAYNNALPLVTLSQRVRWTLRTPRFNHLVVRPTDGSADVTITSGAWHVHLNIIIYHVTGKESDHFLNMTTNIEGLTQMIHQAQRQHSHTIQSNVSNHRAEIHLGNFNRALKIIRWALLPSHLQDNTGRNDYFMFANDPPLPLPPGPGVAPGMSPYNPIISWGIEATGLVIQREIDNLYSRTYLRHFIFPSPHGENIFFQSYSAVPLANNASLGMLDYNNLPHPRLFINFGVNGTGQDSDNPLIAQTLHVIIIADDYNFWYFNRGGWARCFN